MRPDDRGFHPSEGRMLDLAARLVPRGEDEDLVAHLRACSVCEDTFKRMVGDFERSRSLAADGAIAVGSKRRKQVLPFPRSFVRPATVLAAAACVLVVLMTLRTQDDATRALLGEIHALPDPRDLRVSRGWGETPVPGAEDAALESGFAAYGRGDVREAIRYLKNASEVGELEVLRLAYLGNSLARAGRMREAVEALDGLGLDTLPEPWRGEVRWTLYVAFAGSGEEGRADSLLNLLAQETGEVAARARAVQSRSPSR